MKTYVKPEIEEIEILTEGMLAASGEPTVTVDNGTPANDNYEVLSKEHDFSLWEE